MLLAGILIGSRIHLPLPLCAALCAAAAAGGGYFLHIGQRFVLDQWQNRFGRVLIYAALLMAGLTRTAITPQETPSGSIERFTDLGTVSFTGYITDPPAVTSSRTTLRVAVDPQQTDPNTPTSGKVLLVFYRKTDQDYHYGDRLHVSGTVVLPPEGGSFSYRSYLERDGITAMINNPTAEIQPGFTGSHLRAGIYRMRTALVNRIYELFPKPESALMAGILLGDETQISSEIDRAFQKTGTAHIIAISGANFTLLTWIVLSILRKLVPHWWAPVLMIPFIVFYTILVGGNAAVVRAAIMCGLSIIGSVLGRNSSGVNSLALTAGIMGLIKPSILMDLGFQLSVTATLGILLFSGPLCDRCRDILSRIFPNMSEGTLSNTVDLLNEFCLMSICAQVFTLWISAQAFGRISLISLPANFLIAPFQSLIMLGGFAALILSYIFLPLGRITAWLVWPAPALTIRIVRLCAGIRWGSVYSDLPARQAWMIIGLILALYIGRAALRRFFQKRDATLPVMMLLMFISVMVWVNVLDRLDRRTEIRFDGSASSMFLQICSPGKRVFVVTEGLSNYASQEALDRQVLPVSRKPEAAWIDISADWMRDAFLTSGAADGLSIFYLNGTARRTAVDAPQQLATGFTFSADGVRLELTASFLGKRAWIVESDGVRLLIPNGIPPERIFLRGQADPDSISAVLLGKRDEISSWHAYSDSREDFAAILDCSSAGSAAFFIGSGRIYLYK